MKIKNELAIGILLIVAIVFGAIFWNKDNNDDSAFVEDYLQKNTAKPSQTEINENKKPIKTIQGQDDDNWWIYNDTETGIAIAYPETLEAGSNYWKKENVDEKIYIYLHKIKYDTPASEDLFPYAGYEFSSASVEKIMENPSCDQLAKTLQAAFNEVENLGTHVTSVFRNQPNVCESKKIGSNLVFYTIGLQNGYEGYPSIDSSVLVLGKDNAFLIEGAGLNSDYRSKKSSEIQRFLQKYPTTENGSKEQTEGRKLFQEYVIKRLNNPDKEIIEQFEFLKKFASKIRVME